VSGIRADSAKEKPRGNIRDTPRSCDEVSIVHSEDKEAGVLITLVEGHNYHKLDRDVLDLERLDDRLDYKSLVLGGADNFEGTKYPTQTLNFR